jgi:hypothetical protein
VDFGVELPQAGPQGKKPVVRQRASFLELVDDGGEGLAALDFDLDVLRFLQRREVESGKREAKRQEDGQDDEEKAAKKIFHRSFSRKARK